MALWELDEFKPAQFLGFVRSVPEPTQFTGVSFLPNQTVYDLAFEYVLGANRRPVMAHVMGWDSEAPIASRRGQGERVSGELPPIKRKSRIGEKEIARFLAPRANTPDVQLAIDSVYTGVADLLDSIQARVEWLRLQSLSEPSVLYDEGGVQFEFDFGLNSDHQITLTSDGGATDGDGDPVSGYSGDWANPESNWVIDLQRICDTIENNTGRRPAQFVAPRRVQNLWAQSTAVREMIRGEGAATTMLTPGEIAQVSDQYGLPSLVTYDTIIQKEEEDGTVSDVRPLASNKAFFLPEGFAANNKTLWGPTAESRVLYGTPLAGQAPGVWAETYGTTEPPAEWQKAAAVAFPTLPEANLIGQLQFTA